MNSVAVDQLAQSPEEPPTTQGAWRRIRGLLRTRISFVLALAVFAAIFVIGLLAPVISPYDPFAINVPLEPPSAEHLLGTDSLGRDVASIMAWGAQVSVMFALGAAAISMVVGVIVGAVPSYFGGWVDDVSSRLVELILMLPQLFLIILVVALLGQNLFFVVLIVGLTIWPSNARLMRAQVLTLKEMKYVDAAKLSRRPPLWILFRHIVPNGIGPVIANSTLQMAAAVLTEAGLAFLGLGDPNRPSWGQILNDAQQYMIIAPWLAIVPGVALFILLLSLHVIGDNVGRILDPRRETRGIV